MLVVGGGVVGAGVALDAVTRGLSVGLVEARDFASGTSSRSSKLIHGGLRYLEQLNVSLVREALTERALLLQRIAPHLVRPVPFLFPLTHHLWERAYVGTGVTAYDMLGFSLGQPRGLPGHQQLTKRGALQLAPALKRSAITGALQYWDAQVDDARYVVSLVRTAASYGAHIASRTQVTGFLREGERVTGVRAVDLETGQELQIRAQQVVNATGVWTDDVQALVGGRGVINIRASKGVHLVVPRDRIQSRTGIIMRTPSSVLFIIPWGRHWIVGTTDTEWTLDKAHPAASRADIDYVLAQVNRVLAVPLGREDVAGVYAGLRPLLAGESDSTSRLSREHVVAHPVPGLVMIAGGKYTTYRLMARDAVDAVAHGLDWRVAPRAPTRCRWPGPTDTSRCGTRGTGWPGPRGCTWPGSSTCCTGMARWPPRSWTSSRPSRTWAARWPGPRTTCARRSATRPRTRAPATSMTCWPAGPIFPSRPGTAACPPRRRRRPCWPGRSAGTTARWPGKSATTRR